MEGMALDLTDVDLTTETVRTARLVLRPHRRGDVDAVYRGCQDAEIQRWITAIPFPYTREAAREWVCEIAPRARAEGRGMPVVVEAGGELVGASGLIFGTGRLGPEVGYWTVAEARGKGFAAEAATALARWAFERGAARVHLYADVGNTASQAVARSAGFTQEGRVRAVLDQRDGTHGDAFLFSRLKND